MKLIQAKIFAVTFAFILSVHAVLAMSKADNPAKLQPSKNDLLLNELLDSLKKLRTFDPAASLRFASKAIKLSDSLSEPLWKAKFLCNKGISYNRLKMYEEALQNQYDALSVFQHYRDSIHIAKAMYEIGNIYATTQDFEKALNYHFNALYLREYDTSKMPRAKSYLAIGKILMQMKDNWRALDFLLNARLILEKEKDTALLVSTFTSLGELMLQMQRYNEAIDNLDKAIALSASDAQKSRILLLKASLLLQINKLDEAAQILKDIEGKIKKSPDYDLLVNYHALQRNIYRSAGQLEKALNHSDLLNMYQDSLRMAQRSEEMGRLQLKYETKQLEDANEILKLQLKEIAFQNRLKGHLISILLLGIFAAIVISLLLRNRRANQRLQEVNQMLEQKVEERTAELRKQGEDLQSAYTALKKSEVLFRTINETVPLGIVVTDTSGNAVIHNQHLSALGFREEELANQTWFSHIIPDDRKKIQDLWEGAHKHQKTLPETLFRITLNNELKWLRMRGMCLDLEGTFSGMVVVLEDFSAVKKYEQDLIKAKEKAEESDKLKSTFLANMSHEIRTPMNAILGFADLLPSDEYSDEEKQEFINTIQSSGQLLLNLINDIIDISKIEAGELKVIPATFELGELMETLYQTFRQQLDNAGKQDVRLILSNKEASRDYVIHTDKLRLQQILTNLLSNAVKFTQEGEIEFGVISISDQYQFYVKDTGIGIPESKLDVVFDRFRQADDSHTKHYGGTGLGLAISKNLTHLLGGKIWVESVVGKGTSFYFTLPGKKENKETLTSYPDYSNKKVLVVEDVEANFHLLNNMLRRSGIKVLYAPNGYVALDLAQSELPDLILMDIQLPEMDGVATLRNLRKQHYHKPVVAITAFALASDAQYYLRQGFDSYLSKPLGLEKLYQLLHLFFDPEYSLNNETGIHTND